MFKPDPLKLQVCELYDQYYAALDDEDYKTWLSLFQPEALYRVVTRENWDMGLPISTIKCEGTKMLEDRVAAIDRTMMFAPRAYRRFYSSVIVNHASGELSARSSFLTVQTETDKATEAAFTGLALDKFSLEEGQLKLTERICILDTEMLPNSLIYPL